MNRNALFFLAVVGVGAVLIYRLPEVGLHRLTPGILTLATPEPTKQPSPTPSPTPAELEPAPVDQQPTPGTAPLEDEPAPQGWYKSPPTRCRDGSKLTITSRDSNQTNFRCASGTIGAYTN